MKSTNQITKLLCLITLSSTAVFAQNPSPPTPPPTTQSIFNSMDFGAMYGKMMKAMMDEATKPENAERLAKFQKAYFDALVKEGFSKDQALIIVAQRNPMPSGMGPK